MSQLLLQQEINKFNNSFFFQIFADRVRCCKRKLTLTYSDWRSKQFDVSPNVLRRNELLVLVSERK